MKRGAILFALFLTACAAQKAAQDPATNQKPARQLDEEQQRTSTVMDARTELERAEAELSRALGGSPVPGAPSPMHTPNTTSDCATACRALASLERATNRLCSLAEEEADRQRCEDARAKLKSSRERVKIACSVCPQGPNLDASP